MISSQVTKLVFYQFNTQVVNLIGLQDDLTNLYINNAVVTMTLVDNLGNSVQGCIAIPMNYVSNTNGNYQGTFGDGNFQPNVGTGYRLYIDGSSGGSTIHLEIIVEVAARRF